MVLVVLRRSSVDNLLAVCSFLFAYFKFLLRYFPLLSLHFLSSGDPVEESARKEHTFLYIMEMPYIVKIVLFFSVQKKNGKSMKKDFVRGETSLSAMVQ